MCPGSSQNTEIKDDMQKLGCFCTYHADVFHTHTHLLAVGHRDSGCNVLLLKSECLFCTLSFQISVYVQHNNCNIICTYKYDDHYQPNAHHNTNSNIIITPILSTSQHNSTNMELHHNNI